MSKEDMKTNDNKKSSSEKETNINSNTKIKYFQDSPNSDDNEKDKPIHFKIEYDQNKKFENQMESSPEKNDNKNQSQTNKKNQEFIIEKNNQTNTNNNHPDNSHENKNMNNVESNENNKYYNLLKENPDNNNDNENEQNDNFNNYYYHYLNNFNNNKYRQNFDEDEEESEPKKIISFATQTYQGRIDPVKLNRKYNNFWEKQNKSKQKYKQKMDALKKVFNPYGYTGYKTVINNNKKRRMSQSRITTGISLYNYERPPFDNTKQPLPKQSYL